jgi:histidinol phosphatase-like enzyme (inositol monophosphatase family)
MELALQLANDAARCILPHYQSATLAVHGKADSSPVTIADRDAEECIRRGIERWFPRDGILGEEFGDRPGTTGYRWIVDPLDGTKSFIHGVPLFGTLIGVEYQGEPAIGVCHFPALDETVWAATGSGAWWRTPRTPRPVRCRVNATTDLAHAVFCFTTVAGFDSIQRSDAFDHFVAKCQRSRGWGDCYGHAMVATGRCDLMIDALMNPWDIAALVPIVQEAGGVFMNWDGDCDVNGGNGISVVPGLKDLVLDVTRR